MHILPDFLRQGLENVPNGDLIVANDEGRIHLLLKLPAAAFKLLPLPPRISTFLFLAPMPTAPVVGWYIEIADEEPLCFNVVLNVNDPTQNEILANLPEQIEVPFHIINGETLELAGTTVIATPFNARKIYDGALSCAGRITADQYDFTAAKKQFERDYPVNRIASWRPY